MAEGETVMENDAAPSSWQTLLALPYEVQIVLFAGYAAYKVSTIGRSVTHRTEDFFLQVLLFRTIGRFSVASVALLGVPLPLGESARLAVIGFATLAVSLIAAGLWRRALQRKWVSLMGALKVYHDDHEPSVMASLIATGAQWRSVMIHCDDGSVYFSDFAKVDEKVPMGLIKINGDGVAMYVTQIYRSDDSESEIIVEDDDFGYRVTFFPISTIKRIEVGWRL